MKKIKPFKKLWMFALLLSIVVTSCDFTSKSKQGAKERQKLTSSLNKAEMRRELIGELTIGFEKDYTCYRMFVLAEPAHESKFYDLDIQAYNSADASEILKIEKFQTDHYITFEKNMGKTIFVKQIYYQRIPPNKDKDTNVTMNYVK